MSRIIPKKRVGYKWGNPLRERAQKLQNDKFCSANKLSSVPDNDPIIQDSSQVSIVNLEEIRSSPLIKGKSQLKYPNNAEPKKVVKRRIVKKRKKAVVKPSIRSNIAARTQKRLLEIQEEEMSSLCDTSNEAEFIVPDNDSCLEINLDGESNLIEYDPEEINLSEL